ncbi:CRISPR-associated protein Csm3 [Hydrocoleum sp. CS-953]|uniref:type III CRISPR-associated RAMP protein Csx7 n=2 Tax=Microcoleaceae TaxID=1892252 RepID=UPI000B9C69A2|nr:CRISPR-associated RAMP protein Csx7 [Hydrocoleum sp. CS-953]OZH51980.1 CRISPR-associated protein Csm3 [Hydrocoleum sp. CS-953]
MFDTFKNRLEIEGKLTTVTALRIGAARSTEPIGSDLPVVKDVLGQPLIPGSSFKGALRSRLESFLRGILGSNPRLVANPAVNEEWCITAEAMKELKEKHTNDAQLTAAILEKTDLISHLFGSPWVASKFQVRDLTVLPENWFGQYQERDGVAIDRDTETAADGKLYDFQVVPGGTPFLFKAVVENAEDWELGLLMVGLHQFETEQIPLGGGRSRGLGVVKLEIEKMNWFDARNEEDPTKTDPQKLIGYLQQLVSEKTPTFDDGKELKDDWVKALINHLKQKVSTTVEVEIQ